jgi:pimeloyl-ACP methyl ester carboxylesterase
VSDPWRSSRLDAAGGLSLHVREHGAGPACLFVHGSGEGGFVWADLAPQLHPGYRALTLDLRGHGDSSWDPEGRYDIHRHVADALQTIDSLGLESLVIVGHSLGGDVALRCAAELGDRVRGVVAVDFGPFLNMDAIEKGRQRFAELFREYRSVAEFEELLRNDRRCWSAPTSPTTRGSASSWVRSAARRWS